jgi:hypothetical protein
MGKVIVIENANIATALVLALVVHEIFHADVVVVYTADPKVIMA